MMRFVCNDSYKLRNEDSYKKRADDLTNYFARVQDVLKMYGWLQIKMLSIVSDVKLSRLSVVLES